jgi:hypothetical protein
MFSSMINKKRSLGFILLLGSFQALAEEAIPAQSAIESRTSVVGFASIDAFLSRSSEDRRITDNLRTKKFEIKLTQEITDKVRAVVVAKIEESLREAGRTEITSFEIDSLVKEAFIEIHDVGGMPVAFVLGMQEVAWAQDLHKMPIYHNSPLHELADADQGQVVGLTVSLEKNFFGLFDKFEMSLFETDSGIGIGSFDGAAVRLSKQMTEKIAGEVSYMHRGNGSAPDEDRASLGLVYKSGAWTAWVEGIWFQNNSIYKNGNYALTLGLSREFKHGEIVIESTWVEKSLWDVGIGYQFYLDKNRRWTLGPELRFTQFEKSFSGRESSVSAGFRLSYSFGDKRKKRLGLGHNKD